MTLMKMKAMQFGIKKVFLVWGMVLLVGCIVVSPRASAQTSRATISGTIQDPTGASIPQATVVITNIDTGIARTIVTNSSGNYNAASMVPGNYTIKVSAKGFSGEMRKGVVLAVGESALLNISLKLGNVSEEVVVTESPASVDVTSSQLSDTVTGNTMRQMPLNGRSWTDLAALNPGVTTIATQPPVGAPDRVKRGLGGELSIAGGRPQANSYLLDGININDYSNAGPGSVLGGNLGVDALQEFNVITTNPTAQYGRTSGGVISAVTRSGTNKFHGSVYEFYRNDMLDARDYFNTVANGPKNSFTRNQYGASFGGPIQKDKTFFFADYEGVRQNLTTSVLQQVPTAAARNGTSCSGYSDPCPSVDPAVLAFINAFYPLPNTTSSSDTPDIGSFNIPLPQLTTENYIIGKLDHTFSTKDSVAGVYMYDASPSSSPDEFNNVLIFSKTIRQTVSILETHIFNSNTVNTMHIGFNRDNAGSPYSATAVNPLAAAGTSQYSFQPTDSPGIVIVPGLTAFTGGVSAANPLLFHWNSFQAADDFSHTAGINNFTMGFALERIQDNQKDADFPGGQFQYPTLESFLTNGNLATGGQAVQFNSTLPVALTPRNVRQTIFGAYIQDDLRATPNLTFNLGLRYEIASVPYEINGRFSNLRTLTNGAGPMNADGTVGPEPFLGNPYIKNPTFGNVEPRVGFAWDPFKDGKTSVRGAFGIYDNLPYIVEMGSGLDAVYPFSQDVGAVAPAGSFPGGVYNIAANSPIARNYYVLQYDPPRNYDMMYNLNIQRALDSHTTLMVAYVGSRGKHNWYQTDNGNIALPVYHDTASNEYYWPGPNPTCTAAGNCQPYLSGAIQNPNAAQVLDARWNGSNYFDGLETQLTESVWHGFEGQASYTWSRCIDTSSGSAASDQYRQSLNLDLYTAPSTHRGPCDTNVGQTLSINGTWNLPGTSFSNVLAKIVTNGWQLGGIFTGSAGMPFSVVIGGDPLGTNAVGPGAFDFPDRLKGNGCDKNLTTGDPNAYINFKCFAFPDPINRMGNAGRNELTGPGEDSLAFTAFKNNKVSWIAKDADLQLRLEVYNLLNHPNLDVPASNFTLYDGSGSTTPVPFAGQITQTTLSNRQIQLAVKLSF